MVNVKNTVFVCNEEQYAEFGMAIEYLPYIQGISTSAIKEKSTQGISVLLNKLISCSSVL